MMAPPGAWSAEEVQVPSGDAASSGSTTGADALREILSGATEGISANPGAVNILTGTGLLGRLLGFGPDSGVRLGGLWIGDANYLFAGGAEPRTWSFNSLLLVDLSLAAEESERAVRGRVPSAQWPGREWSGRFDNGT
jgi:carbohydrate-selective porin OprB